MDDPLTVELKRRVRRALRLGIIDKGSAAFIRRRAVLRHAAGCPRWSNFNYPCRCVPVITIEMPPNRLMRLTKEGLLCDPNGSGAPVH